MPNASHSIDTKRLSADITHNLLVKMRQVLDNLAGNNLFQ